MKTAISIPDPVFAAAEKLAKRLHMSRSELYRTALTAYIAEHADADITSKLNAIYSTEPAKVDEVADAMQFRSLPKEDW